MPVLLSYRGQAALCQHLSLTLSHTRSLPPSLLPLSGLAFFTIPWSSRLGGVTPWCTHPSTSSLSTPVISKLRVLAACRGWESVTRNSFSPIPHGTMCCFGSWLVPLVDGLTVLPPSPSQVWQKEIKNSHAPAPAQISLRGERIPSFSMIRSIISEASNRTSCPFPLSLSLSLPPSLSRWPGTFTAARYQTRVGQRKWREITVTAPRGRAGARTALRRTIYA